MDEWFAGLQATLLFLGRWYSNTPSLPAAPPCPPDAVPAQANTASSDTTSLSYSHLRRFPAMGSSAAPRPWPSH